MFRQVLNPANAINSFAKSLFPFFGLDLTVVYYTAKMKFSLQEQNKKSRVGKIGLSSSLTEHDQVILWTF